MKKVFAIVLCGAVLFNTVGFIILFSTASFEWKQFIADELEKKNSTEHLVRLTDNSTIHHLNNHEILSAGKLYDVARVTKENGSTVLYCYHDNNEERMDAQLFKGIQQNTDNSAQNSAPSKSLVKQAVNDYLPEKKMELSFSTLSLNNIIPANFSIVTGIFLSIQVPPPRG